MSAKIRSTLPGELAEEALLDTIRAARLLLGWVLVRRHEGSVRRARIVETEAYLENDPASHSCRGRTRRNRSMFGPPGQAYVYRIHQVVCLNVVTGPVERGEAVLIRALEPMEGRELMERARSRRTVGRAMPTGYSLTNGPGKLCQALDITLAHDGCRLLASNRTSRELCLEPPSVAHTVPAALPDVTWSRGGRFRIEQDTRVGISKATAEPLRFFISGNPWVSVPRKAGLGPRSRC